MLRSICEGKHSSKLTLLHDTETVGLYDLFKVFLSDSICNYSPSQIHLLCFENPPDFYLADSIKGEGINVYDFFKDPCGWNNTSTVNLSTILLNQIDLPGQVWFIDSLYHLVSKFSFCKAYKILYSLKVNCKTIVSVVHDDLFNANELEKFYYLTTTCITVRNNYHDETGAESDKKIVDIRFTKPNFKVIIQTEIFYISDGSKLSSELYKNNLTSPQINKKASSDFKNLTTFELGLQMKDSERRARDKLVLPYLRCESKEQEAGIIYDLEAIDLEDDPDDDLDF